MLYKCIKVRDIGKYVFKIGQKWENKVKGAHVPFEVTRNRNIRIENGLKEVKR
jgi:hypothetical protein